LSPQHLHLVVPGRLDQRTGGYRYDARMVDGLRAQGWTVRVHPLEGRFPGTDTAAEQALKDTLATLPDVAWVVLDGLASGTFPGPLEAHTKRLRLITLVHHPLYQETGLHPEQARHWKTLEARALVVCRGLIVSSPSTGRHLRAWLNPDAPGASSAGPAIRVVIPGTEVGVLDTTAPVPPRDPAAAPRLLCVASLVPRKGQDLLMQALGSLRNRAWTCDLVGSLDRDPGYVDRVRQAGETAGIADRIRFLGECDDARLHTLYATAGLFVLPSWHEGYGMVLTEAMAHGLPVVATTGGAIPDTVPAQAGLLVPPGAPAALAAALARLLDDPALRERLAQGARDLSRTLPNWTQAADRFAAAVVELAGP